MGSSLDSSNSGESMGSSLDSISEVSTDSLFSRESSNLTHESSNLTHESSNVTTETSICDSGFLKCIILMQIA